MSERPQHVPAPPPSVDQLVTDDGEPMETTRHRDQMILLIRSLQASFKRRDEVYVSGNMFVYFSETQARNNDFRGPDVFVVLAADPRKERRAWVVWEEDGQTPDVVIELTSDSTRKEDHGRKKVVYGRALKVGEYFIFDPWSGELEGFDRTLGGHYEPKIPDERGYLRCRQLGLWLGTRAGTLFNTTCEWLRWIDDEGAVLPEPEELATVAKSEAEAAKQQARAAEARSQDLAEQLAAYERQFGKLK